MPAKNAIRIKKEFEKEFLATALFLCYKVEKAKVSEPRYITYLMKFKNFNEAFRFGYNFKVVIDKKANNK